jgi:outer membrane protein assembly factor BamB
MVCSAACAFGQGTGMATDWNVFRGPGAGVSPWTNAPVTWDGASGEGVLWKAPLKMTGVSSPVLWGNRLYITEGDDKERAVLAFDAGDGHLLWRRAVVDGGEGTPLPAVSDYGLAMPTATCDSNGVYALFGTGDLAAFSPDGTLLWQLYLKRPTIGYGFASSPCVVSNLVFVQFDHHAAGRMLAVETTTGKIKWDIERSRGASWSSLMVVPGSNGQPVVVANANGSTTGYDLSGNVMWDVDGATGEVSPSPVWWNGCIYSVNVGSQLLCHKVHGTAEKRWDYTGQLSDTASPIVVNGLFFMVTSSGKLTCLDAAAGKELWTQEGPGCYASLVSSGDRVYAMGRNGNTLILGADRTYRAIGTCGLGDAADATPAMTAGRFYFRSSKWLWCIGDKKADQP